jgi:hypothetical protein
MTDVTTPMTTIESGPLTEERLGLIDSTRRVPIACLSERSRCPQIRGCREFGSHAARRTEGPPATA